jgi:hypothetical protein
VFRRAGLELINLSGSGGGSMARFARRYFFYGSLLAGAIPKGGFGSTVSLKPGDINRPMRS